MNLKKTLSLVLAFVLMIPGCIVNAEEKTTANTSVMGSITATVLSVSVPASMVFSVDPNNKEDTYSASVANIRNDTNAPIKVSIGAGDNFLQSSNSSWKPADYLPGEKDWNALGVADTENSLALGVVIKDIDKWRKVMRSTALWVVEQQSLSEPAVFGEIEANSTAPVTLEINHGNAFSEPKTCEYNILWTFALAD